MGGVRVVGDELEEEKEDWDVRNKNTVQQKKIK